MHDAEAVGKMSHSEALEDCAADVDGDDDGPAYIPDCVFLCGGHGTVRIRMSFSDSFRAFFSKKSENSSSEMFLESRTEIILEFLETIISG
jgi:hypothetical protein